jgi:DNA-directed RNA polymerase specialized sigma24 family protein
VDVAPAAATVVLMVDSELVEETNRLLATLIRMQSDNQTEAILEMSRSGIPNGRIAALLGTTTGTVKVAVRRAKRKADGGSAKASGDADG